MNGLVIAFDCDGTLDISEEDPGPVPATAMNRLLMHNAVVGICGNTDPIRKHGYDEGLHFLTLHKDKAISLRMTSDLYPGRFYVFVGNTTGDQEAAREAGWTFVQAEDFQYGRRDDS